MKALSIKLPWAWLIVNGWKPVENRSRRSHHRGPVVIHASARMTRWDYEACAIFWSCIDMPPEFEFPSFEDLLPLRGGIIGHVEMVDCVTESKSPWFNGEFGYVFEDPVALDFEPCKGQLNFFNVEMKLCGVCQSPIGDTDTSCRACGSTDFDT